MRYALALALALLFGCDESAVGSLAPTLPDLPQADAADQGASPVDQGGGSTTLDGAILTDSAPRLDVAPPREDASDAATPTDAAPADGALNDGAPGPDALPGCREEVCDGIDNDCDGEIDEEIAEIGQPCGLDEGRCRLGVWACNDGQRFCEGSIGRRDEVCNGMDDDCDGEIDEALEGAGEGCAIGAGCGEGVRACVSGEWGCVGESNGAEEVCDGLDNDCNGQVDEADPQLGQPCGVDTGACELGAIECFGGVLTCLGNVAPVDEQCDGIDNDCDGEIDESDVTQGGAPCPAVGEACASDMSCAEGPCVDDYGNHYCSLSCADEAAVCPDPLRCEIRGGRSVCVKVEADCRSNAECAEGESCALLPPRYEGDLGARCHPVSLEGAQVGDACGGEVACANAMCLARVGHCSALCTATDCPEGMACGLVPFFIAENETVDLGLCFKACERDGQCPEGQLCQYGWRADQGAVVGTCDGPFGAEPVGGSCDAGCDHGLCRNDGGERYCTQGCTTALDCPDGWTCEFSPISPTVERGVCAR